MYNIPLPLEILEKVNEYLNPVFNYKKYIQNIKIYNQTVEDFEALPTKSKKQYLHKINKEKHNSEIIETLEEKYEIIIISLKQLQYLIKIDEFIRKNPKFLRPVLKKNSTKYYREQFGVYYTEKNMSRMEANLRITRGIWQGPIDGQEINIINDINILHKEGTLKDLSFACLINNVGYIVEEFDDYMLNELFLNTSIQSVKERYYIWFCSKWRWKNEIDYSAPKYVRKERQYFINLLMKI